MQIKSLLLLVFSTDEIKFVGTPKAYEKSRLVVQAYTVMTMTRTQFLHGQSPTIQRVSQRLILCLAVSIQGLNIYLRDISQAYTQSHTFLVRDFYVRPPQELNAWNDVPYQNLQERSERD